MIWNWNLRFFFYIVFILKLQFGVFYFDITKFEIKFKVCFDFMKHLNYELMVEIKLGFNCHISEKSKFNLNSLLIHQSLLSFVCVGFIMVGELVG